MNVVIIASLHDMLFIINISWIGLAPGEFTASSLMVLGCDWPVPLEPSTELGRRSWVGSAVQAEVPGATIVSLSSNLYYLYYLLLAKTVPCLLSRGLMFLPVYRRLSCSGLSLLVPLGVAPSWALVLRPPITLCLIVA